MPAQKAAQVLASDASVSGYGPAEGMPALREALRAKVARVNKLTNVSGSALARSQGGSLQAGQPRGPLGTV